jgi:hypothetical protein
MAALAQPLSKRYFFRYFFIHWNLHRVELPCRGFRNAWHLILTGCITFYIPFGITSDERPVELGAFGTYDFVHPDLTLSPSPIREVFKKVTVWDIVLVNPTPGVHILQGVAKVENEIYTWVANFAIETASIP